MEVKRSLHKDQLHVSQVVKETLLKLFTARKRNLGQGNVFTGVCLSMGDWLPSMHHISYGPGGLHPGGLGRLPGSAYGVRGVGEGSWADLPEIHRILWDTANKPAVRILLECFLV